MALIVGETKTNLKSTACICAQIIVSIVRPRGIKNKLK